MAALDPDLHGLASAAQMFSFETVSIGRETASLFGSNSVARIGEDDVMTKFKCGLLATAAVAIVCVPVWAQDNSDDDAPVEATTPTPTATPTPTSTDEVEGKVVVRGIRSALQRSAEMKRNADNIQDSISAEEVAEFPDETAVEALARITGVQITRDDGEGSSFRIRGIDFNRVEINGESSVGGNGSRDGDLGTIPAGLLKNLVVVKTPTADMIEGAIGGTVQLNTRRPFDFRKPTLTLSPSVSYGTESESADPRFTFLATDRWKTKFGEFGALISASYTESNWTREQLQLNSWAGACNFDIDGDGVVNNGSFRRPYTAGDDGLLYTDDDVSVGTDGAVGGAYCVTDPDDFAFRPGAVRINSVDRERIRNGVNLGLQWRPNNQLTLYTDAIFNQYENHQVNYAIRSGTVGINGGYRFVDGVRTGAYLDGLTVNENGVADSMSIVAGQGNGIRIFSETGYSTGESQSSQVTVGYRWNPNDDWLLTGNLIYASGENDAYSQSVTLRAGADSDVRFDMAWSEHSFRLTSATDLTDPSLFRTRNSYKGANASNRDELIARADFHYTPGDFLGPIKKLQFGMRFTDVAFERSQFSENKYLGNGTNISNVPELDGTYSVRDLSDMFDNVSNVLVPSGIIAFDANSLRNDPSVYDEVFGHSGSLDPVPQNEYEFQEWTSAAYGRLNFETSILGRKVDGNLGLRVTGTRIATDTVLLVDDLGDDDLSNNVYAPVRDSNAYWNYLPSMNIRAVLDEDLFIRFGAASTMKRFGYYLLRPTGYINTGAGGSGTFDDPYESANRGNPYLEPREGMQFDISIEKYFGSRDLVSLALFTREVTNFGVDVRQLEEYPTFPNDLNETPTYAWTTIRVNGEEAYANGLEASVQYTFDQFDSWLGGFGLLGNYTLSESEANGTEEFNTDFDGTTLGLFGLSKHTVNVSGFYEKYGFNARLSYNWRSDWRAGGKFDGRQQFNAPVGTLDFSSGYRINDNYRVYFNARNLTQTVNYRYAHTEDALRQMIVNDTRYIVGLNAKF